MSSTPTPTSDLTSFLGSNPQVSRLYDNIQATVPAVLLAVIKMEAWNTIEEFYVHSTLRREPVAWQMAPGVREVDFNPWDASWLVAWVLEFRGLPAYRVIPPARVVDQRPSQTPRHGHALLALKPVSMTAIENGNIGPELWSNWFSTIESGVLWRLYRMPAKPYSSPQLGEYHSKIYRAGVTRARAVADGGNTDGGGRWGFPYFAHGRRKN